jgi:hypothetical protein
MKHAFLALLGLTFGISAFATADGPDHYRVTGILAGRSLDLRGQANADAPDIGRIPADAKCLRNLGCQGGLSFDEFNHLSESEKQRRLATNPRWCKVEYQGATGWVEGRFLTEDACADTAPGQEQRMVAFPDGKQSTTVKGRIQGRGFVDYRVNAGAGQTLAVTLRGSHVQNYFNVLPPSSEAAMFIGSSSGNRFAAMLPMEGEYTIRVYLMRAAARRNAASRYTLGIALTGKPLPPIPATVDALIPGTQFHASATLACTSADDPRLSTCEAFVIRRNFDGTATVEVRRPDASKRRILFVQGRPVASDATGPVTFTRRGDLSIIDIGPGERFNIPDALVFGG